MKQNKWLDMIKYYYAVSGKITKIYVDDRSNIWQNVLYD